MMQLHPFDELSNEIYDILRADDIAARAKDELKKPEDDDQHGERNVTALLAAHGPETEERKQIAKTISSLSDANYQKVQLADEKAKRIVSSFVKLIVEPSTSKQIANAFRSSNVWKITICRMNGDNILI